MNIEKLRNEIETDPLERGYAGKTDQQAADDLNTAYRTRIKATMLATEVMNAIDKAEFDLLLPTAQQRVWDILHMGVINPNGVEKDMFVSVFGAQSDTIGNLAAARTESISRATELGLSKVKPGHVAMARA